MQRAKSPALQVVPHTYRKSKQEGPIRIANVFVLGDNRIGVVLSRSRLTFTEALAFCDN